MRLLLLTLAAASFCSTAQAGDISSAYTDLDWQKDCVTYAQAEEGEGDWSDMVCSGYRGYPVMAAYDDARESLYYGFPAADMTAVWESFVGFNSAGPKIEWRIETDGDIAVPFAAIQRRSVASADGSDKKIEVLVVSKVGQPEEKQGCTVGLVLASGVADANAAAQKLADEKARGFTCGKDERVTVGAVPAFGRVDN